MIAWERYTHEVEGAAASTIRRRLAALSSLYLSTWCGTARRPSASFSRLNSGHDEPQRPKIGKCAGNADRGSRSSELRDSVQQDIKWRHTK